MKALMDCEGKKTIMEDTKRMSYRDSDHDDMLMEICDHDIDIVDHASSRHPGRNKQAGKGRKKIFFEVMLDFCFFENDDEASKVAADVLKSKESANQNVDDSYLKDNPSLLFRSPHDLHEQFIDRLQFFIDALNLMGESHVG